MDTIEQLIRSLEAGGLPALPGYFPTADPAYTSPANNMQSSLLQMVGQGPGAAQAANNAQGAQTTSTLMQMMMNSGGSLSATGGSFD